MSSSVTKAFDGFTTRSQHSKRQKEKEKCILGVCAIFKQISVVQGTSIIGGGFLVKELFPGFERKHHLVACESVIPSKNLEGYLLCFKNSNLTDKKRVPLQSVVNAADDFIRHSGLVFIPLDPGKLNPRSGLVNHRPFRTRIERQGFELHCQVVEEYGMSSFVVKPHQLLENENGQYSLSEFRHDSHRKRLPVAPITIDVDGEAVVVGALTSTENASPVFFSKIPLTSAGTRRDMQLDPGSAVLADGATASALASGKDQQTKNGVQSSAGTRRDMQLDPGSAVLADGATASGLASGKDQQTKNGVQSSAGTRRDMQLDPGSNVLGDGATASGLASAKDQQTKNGVQSSAGASKFNVAIKGGSGPVMLGDHNSLTIGSPNCESNANTVQQQYADEARTRKGSAGNTKTENEGASKFNVAIEGCSGPVMLGDFSSLNIASTPGDEQH